MSERARRGPAEMDDAFSDASDEDLVRQICAGSMEALDALVVDRYGALLSMIANRFRFDGEIFQEVRVRLLGKTGDWKPLLSWSGGETIGPWLREIATNICLDDYRRRSSHQDRFERLNEWEDVHDDETGPAGQAIMRETRSRVLVAIEKLPPTWRSVILLNVYGDLPLSEVAETLGLTHDNARKIKSRAIQALRAFLGEGSDDV